MNYNIPDHFSYHFELDLDKIPTKQSDRIAFGLLFPGLLCALFLIILALFELFHGVRPENPSDIVPFWFSLTAFDFALIALGLWISIKIFMTYFRYKKVRWYHQDE